VFLDHFFGENHCFRPFRPINTPKCYTWLESYGSPPYDDKKKKLFFSPYEASDFWWRSRTDFLHDLRLRLIQIVKWSKNWSVFFLAALWAVWRAPIRLKQKPDKSLFVRLRWTKGSHHHHALVIVYDHKNVPAYILTKYVSKHKYLTKIRCLHIFMAVRPLVNMYMLWFVFLRWKIYTCILYVPKCIQKCVYNCCYVCIQMREVYDSCI